MESSTAPGQTRPPGPPDHFGKPDPSEDPNRYPYATWSPWIAIGGAIAALTLGVIYALPVLWAAGGDDFGELSWGFKALVQLCTGLGFISVSLFFAKMLPGGVNWREALGRLGFHRFKLLNAVKWIVIGIVAYLAFAALYALAFGTPKQDDIAGEFGPLWVQILLIVIVAPVTEEVCFRGMLFGGFRTRFKWPLAALGTALVFGSLHLSTGASAVPQLMVLGLMFAMVYEKTESIWPPIIFHLINNAYALAIINS